MPSSKWNLRNWMNVIRKTENSSNLRYNNNNAMFGSFSKKVNIRRRTKHQSLWWMFCRELFRLFEKERRREELIIRKPINIDRRTINMFVWFFRNETIFRLKWNNVHCAFEIWNDSVFLCLFIFRLFKLSVGRFALVVGSCLKFHFECKQWKWSMIRSSVFCITVPSAQFEQCFAFHKLWIDIISFILFVVSFIFNILNRCCTKIQTNISRTKKESLTVVFALDSSRFSIESFCVLFQGSSKANNEPNST